MFCVPPCCGLRTNHWCISRLPARHSDSITIPLERLPRLAHRWSSRPTTPMYCMWPRRGSTGSNPTAVSRLLSEPQSWTQSLLNSLDSRVVVLSRAKTFQLLERAWAILFESEQALGDSIRLRQISDLMLRQVARPGYYLAGYTIPANTRMSQWYLNVGARDQRLFSFSDSLIYYDNRIDAAMVLGNSALSKHESEEVVRLFNRERSNFDASPDELAILAYAQAAAGQEGNAKQTLTRAIDLARKKQPVQYPIDQIYSDRVAVTYDRLGDSAGTVAWLEAGLRGYSTTASYMIQPRLAAFRTTQVWRDFVKSHPVQAR
jgi:hypothetical protein